MSEKFTTEELQAFAKEVHANARAKGFWDEPTGMIARLALVIGEIGEAVECIQKNQLETVISESGKPEGLGSEIADVLIRLLDIAEGDELEISAPHDFKPCALFDPAIKLKQLFWLSRAVCLNSLSAAIDNTFLTAQLFGIDLKEEALQKHQYNLTRPHMHGKVI